MTRPGLFGVGRSGVFKKFRFGVFSLFSSFQRPSLCRTFAPMSLRLPPQRAYNFVGVSGTLSTLPSLCLPRCPFPSLYSPQEPSSLASCSGKSSMTVMIPPSPLSCLLLLVRPCLGFSHSTVSNAISKLPPNFESKPMRQDARQTPLDSRNHSVYVRFVSVELLLRGNKNRKSPQFAKFERDRRESNLSRFRFVPFSSVSFPVSRIIAPRRSRRPFQQGPNHRRARNPEDQVKTCAEDFVHKQKA